jgi:DNA-binding LacI/PurR family transcriptional regulator
MNSDPVAAGKNEAPPTLRRIAELAGVSPMTVSRALGNRLRIAEKTRQRIQVIAERIGYRPDPELSKLMHHLRGRKRLSFQSVICGITTRIPGAKEPYSDAVVAGARLQAGARGYGFLLRRVSVEPGDWAGVQRMLRNRGVQGILLLPPRAPVDLSQLLDWREFSVVAATSSMIAPEVHRATPHHFANALLLCRRLAAAGYRRIGFVTTREHDLRVNHVFSAVVTWHGLNEAVEAVKPLVLERDPTRALTEWFQRERPDVIVATDERSCRDYAKWLRLRIPGPVGFACTSGVPGGSGDLAVGGIDEGPAGIGAAAVDLLASLVERRVRGLPDSPTVSLLAGTWQSGKSCPART